MNLDMESRVKIATACKDGKPVHISKVSSGLACGCHCPKCKSSLIARKGDVRAAHFAHPKGSECQGAAESILHILAKEILSKLDSIEIPEYPYSRTKTFPSGKVVTHETILANGGRVDIEEVLIEKHRDSYRPDIELYSNGKRLIIEIAVTHKVDKNKLRLIRKDDVPIIEIQLEEKHAMNSFEQLESLIQKDLKCKQWLYHPNVKVADREFLMKCRSVKNRYPKRAIFTNPGPPKNYYRRPQQDSDGSSSWSKTIDEWGVEFNKRHGRYPTQEEAERRFPKYYRKKKF